MTAAAVRRLVRFSHEPALLAEQVGEVVRDLEARTGLQVTRRIWEGIVSYGVKFRLAVPSRPAAVLVTAVHDIDNRTDMIPAPVQWSWQDGHVQVDDSTIGFAAGVRYRVTFLMLEL